LVVVTVDRVQNLALAIGEIALSGITLVSEGAVHGVKDTLSRVAIATVVGTFVAIVTSHWLGCAHSGNTCFWGTLVAGVTSLECVDTLSILTSVVSARIGIIAINSSLLAASIAGIAFSGEAEIDSYAGSFGLIQTLITVGYRSIVAPCGRIARVSGTNKAVATEDVSSDASLLGITELVGTFVVIVASVSGTKYTLSSGSIARVRCTNVGIVTNFRNVRTSNSGIAEVVGTGVMIVTEVGVDTWVT